MSDLESYLSHCYDILLQDKPANEKPGMGSEEELCPCAKLIDHQDRQAH